MTRPSLLVVATCSLLPVAISGCARTFTLDQDAATVADAGPRLVDGGGLVADSAAACASGIEWLDEVPTERVVDLSRSPGLAAGPTGFDLVSSYPDSAACTLYCVRYEHLTTAGVLDTVVAASLDGEVLEPPGVFAGITPSGASRMAFVADRRVWWSETPRDGVWPSALRLVELSATFGALAFSDDGVVIETATAFPRPGLPDVLTGSTTTAYSEGGVASPLDLDPTFGFEFWSPELVVGSAGPWLAVLQDVDFPPTVQLVSLADGSWDGSSCGVESFDLVADAGGVVVSEDCGDTLHVVRRVPELPMRDQIGLPHRDASSHVRSRLAHAAGRFAVAYRGDDGLAYVAVLDAGLALLATDAVPGSRPSTAPLGPLAVAAHPDGTFAVVTSAPYLEGSALGEASLRRFRLCR